ncbi:hypothetical protein NQ314_006093 [Rhamnusium bicolor]|uniref:Uncharacterized protein n=1 Tax=Rhamnusium bicolor TaxID=1586634 RepID=A0AAV8Z9M7_9CUCU|nr:hypothetical protein NQ314_006093 [Rhamnusium bicolor]
MAESVELKKLHKRRCYLKGQLTRFLNYLSTCYDEANILLQLQARLNAIKTTFSEFNSVQVEIEYVDEISDSEMHLREREEFEAKYFEAVSLARKYLQSVENTSQPSSSRPGTLTHINRSSNVNTFNIKLPQINLPEFTGSYEKWTEFHDTFKALINDNPALTKIQKYYYLQASLKNGAAQIISSLAVSEENYDIAWRLLTERFQNTKAIIVSAHIRGIVELPNINKDSYIALRSFLDTFLKHYRALDRLDKNVKYWDTLLIFLLAAKLDMGRLHKAY